MLYYSGTISEMGEVHRGNTVTDFMEQERNRGITIASACVSFPWRNNIINLVDTPGHIDFTMEVELSLKAMDSAVVVLDASAGVEAQTVTVWNQADRHELPRIVYANKCDRNDASVDICLQSLRDSFEIQPLLLNYPVRRKNILEGIVDIVNLEEIFWSNRDNFTKKIIDKSHSLYDDLLEMRDKLTDSLATLDDTLADIVLCKESLSDVTPGDLVGALRRVTIAQKGIPVLCGSSYKNIGVQMLMDAVADLLPSPIDSQRYQVYSHFGNNLAARVFKIIHDKQRGPITFLRLYSGHIEKGQKVYNADQEKSEVVGKLLLANAMDFEEVPRVSRGYLVAVTGLKEAVTGDLICSSSSIVKTVKDKIKHSSKSSNTSDDVFRSNSHIPDPVFFCSVEPPSQAYQIRLDKALTELQREDPSLSVSFNAQTGQTVLAGMGELHLEIIRDRIKTEYNVDVYLGPLQIIYKEQLMSEATETVVIKNSVGSHNQMVTLTMSLRPGNKKDILILDLSKDSGSNLAHVSQQHLNAIKRGIQSALLHGPLLSSPVKTV
ncbi:hypothetical protein AAG570_000788 [Ranatra chinensis]|uniref:Tr-type G domain-containing protein n=1 Tax=Ranatra chinensis TaxID=642074 RepID=A0ABD0YYD6_9HEMI